MKALHLLWVAVFAFSLSLSAISSDVLAATEKKELTAPAAKAEVSQQVAPVEKSKTTKATKDIPKDVNINTADIETLTLLPGVGPVIAEAIIAYRKTNGNFKNIDELTKVKGIGEKTLVKLKPFLVAI